MAQRTFDDDEVAEILDRASRNPGPDAGRGMPPASGAEGELTLAELQSIGKEVGIPPERITAAARELIGQQATGYPELELKLRIPRELTHRVDLPGPVEDEEWDRLVTLFRIHFGGDGEEMAEGLLRRWKLGDVTASVEPDPLGEGWRLRLTAFHKDAWQRFGVAAVLVLVGIFTFGFTALLAIAGPAGILGLGAVVAGFGVGAWYRLQLPGWVRRRGAQMQEVAKLVNRPASPP